jgi:DNA-binding MarR family transcriptional regulator
MPRRDLERMAEEIDRDLGAIRQILRRPVEAEVARGGLTGPQQSAMSVLVKSQGLSLKELSKELGLAHSTVSGIVDRLVKHGLVERQTDQSDGRLSKVVVSEQVRRFLREKWPRLEMRPLQEALTAATAEERRIVAEGLQVLRRVLERCSAKKRRGTPQDGSGR